MKLTKNDRAWADLVKERDSYSCRRCLRMFPEGERQGLHAHHVFTRSRKSTRHMLLNGVSLCMGHHMWAHRQVLDFHEWMRDELGEAQYDELRQLSQTVAMAKSRATPQP